MNANLTDRRRRIIRADGTIEILEKPHTMRQLEPMLKARTFDTVRLRHLGQPTMVMIVDDNGYETEAVQDTVDTPFGTAARTTLVPTRARKPVNKLATELYHANCAPGTTHQIVGDVAVVPDFDFA